MLVRIFFIVSCFTLSFQAFADPSIRPLPKLDQERLSVQEKQFFSYVLPQVEKMALLRQLAPVANDETAKNHRWRFYLHVLETALKREFDQANLREVYDLGLGFSREIGGINANLFVRFAEELAVDNFAPEFLDYVIENGAVLLPHPRIQARIAAFAVAKCYSLKRYETFGRFPKCLRQLRSLLATRIDYLANAYEGTEETTWDYMSKNLQRLVYDGRWVAEIGFGIQHVLRRHAPRPLAEGLPPTAIPTRVVEKYRSALGEETAFWDIQLTPHNRGQEIPKALHFIWLGSPLPNDYVRNIETFLQVNPDYQVHLWSTDESNMYLPLAAARVSAAHRGTFRNIREILNDESLPASLREVVRRVMQGKYPNYAAAADILRLLILLKEGGIYLDTDVRIATIKRAFGTLYARYGLLIRRCIWEQGIGDKRDGYSNDIMAAPANSQAVKELVSFIDSRIKETDALGEGELLKNVTAAPGEQIRLTSTLALAGPGTISSFLSGVGFNWLRKLGQDISFYDARFLRSTSLTPQKNYRGMSEIYADFSFPNDYFGIPSEVETDGNWMRAGQRQSDVSKALSVYKAASEWAGAGPEAGAGATIESENWWARLLP